MYAKLVYSAGLSSTANTRYSPFNMVRDIVRLCTSPSPNVNNLVAFSNTSSVIIDTTPAGWSLVYSDVDGTTLPDANTDANSSPSSQVNYWAMSAPCLGPVDGTTKYAKLTTTYISNKNALDATRSGGFSLTSAVSVTNTGTVTGEGYRLQYTSGSPTSADATRLTAWDMSGNGTYHVIATQRHLTIIKETVGYHAVWEHSISDYHTFYNITPVIAVVFRGTATGGPNGTAPASTGPLAQASLAGTLDNVRCLHNVTDVNTGTNYSAASMAGQENQPYLSISTYYSNLKTVSRSGTARNMVMPIMFQLMQWGIPTCFVTDVCDMYMCQGGIGTTGDTFNINGSIYNYFDCGSIGLAIGTY
jgi:hypothetical protein